MVNNQPTGFKELLNAMMKRRWFISAIVLGGFMIIIGGIFASIMIQTPMSTEWKELLLLLLGAFIGSYGKIIDYWFSDTGEGSNEQGIFSSGVALALPGRQTQGFWRPTKQTELSSTTEPNAVF